jgi:hypothetical protein
MAEPILNAPRIVAGIGQGVAAGVGVHMCAWAEKAKRACSPMRLMSRSPRRTRRQRS